MPMTIAEKILAVHTNKAEVTPGQIVMCRADVALANDGTAPLAIKEFVRSGARELFDPDRLILVMDHFVPNKDVASAEQVKYVREFAKRHALRHFYDVGRMGIEHVFLPEQGLVVPGDLVIGADSHTVTYGALGAFAAGVGSTDLAAVMITGEIWLRVPESIRLVYQGRLRPWVGGKDLILHTIGDLGVDGARYKAMEFTGDSLAQLPMAGRFAMANMAIEAGGKCGIFVPDEAALVFTRERAKRPWKAYASDPDARYAATRVYDCSRIEPQVALPHSPGNVRSIGQIGAVTIDQAVIGSCTNGWIEDLRLAADVLKGHHVAPHVRLIVIPATQQIYRQAMREGLLEVFLEAGGVVSTPTCGPCLGGYMGVLAQGERAIATTNRNFVGRMGHPGSAVYLANPAVAAASAIAGTIVSPDAL